MSNDWKDTIATAQVFRRELHANPELSWLELGTAAAIRARLDDLHIPWQACAGTGTIATINPDGTTPAIALRGDIDALPIHEQTGKDWQSTREGCMHACGHDGHTATLMAAARWLKHNEDELKQKIILLFQPAEEGGHGAREMIAAGALQGVGEIYGWHNWPALPYGTMACPDDLVMCGNGTFKITLTGRGGHASQPEACADPLLAASAINIALQQIVSRRLAPQKSAVISVTSIHGGDALTVIPQTSEVAGSIRVPDEETRTTIKELITDISVQTAGAYGVKCEVEHSRRYSATINHPAQAAHARAIWQELYGAEALLHGQSLPIMASEDFSYYLQEIPGAFALIGSNDGPGKGHDISCHSPEYDFNDRLIEDVCRWFCRLSGMKTPP